MEEVIDLCLGFRVVRTPRIAPGSPRTAAPKIFARLLHVVRSRAVLDSRSFMQCIAAIGCNRFITAAFCAQWRKPMKQVTKGCACGLCLRVCGIVLLRLV
jgi:hypothetical protein